MMDVNINVKCLENNAYFEGNNSIFVQTFYYSTSLILYRLVCILLLKKSKNEIQFKNRRVKVLITTSNFDSIGIIIFSLFVGLVIITALLHRLLEFVCILN